MDQLHDFSGAVAGQVAGGLVEEEKVWVGDDGAGNGDALFLSTGELARVVVHAIREADDAKRGFDMLAAIGFRELGEQKRELDVLESGEDRNKVVHLKDEADVARTPLRELVAGHVSNLVAGNGNAAVRGDVEAAEQIEQGGLAGAAGAHEGDEIAFVDVEIEALQDLDFFAAAAIGFVQTADLDETIGFSRAIDSNHCFSLLAYLVLLRDFAPANRGAARLRWAGMLHPYNVIF